MDLVAKNWFIFLLLIFAGPCSALRLLEVRVPAHAVRDQPARLECRFDLEGEALYSVKWYKDGREFFRFLPRDAPPAQLFPLPGLLVDMSQSSANQVQLTAVQLASSGRYRCEVSAEAPSFQTVSDHGEMQVVALPEEGPRISGGRPRYALGDTVKVNCTSGRSRPPAQLMWFINGEQAQASQLRGPYLDPPPEEVGEAGSEALQSAILGLEFLVRARHFKRGDLKLKCLATIATVYWRSNEESVEGERPQRAPALPSRDDAANRERGQGHAPASRADRVHASAGHRPQLFRLWPLSFTTALTAVALVAPHRRLCCS